jgi:hypothetical protein
VVATGYVSTTGDTRKVDVAGDTMTGELIGPDNAPDTALAYATKGYVDSVAGGGGGSGDVVGPATATDNAVARWDGTTGELLQDSGAILADTGALTFVGGRSTADLIIGTAGAKQYRLRQSGGALNFDASGAALYVSVFSAVDFGGTERTYFRLESGVELAHVRGRVEITTDVESASVHALDPTTGVAELGAKNSLSNVRVVGRRATPGAPTTGTWVAGDTAQDSRGAWFLCTVGGTPGTWVGSIDVNSGYVVTGDVTLPNVGSTWTAVTGLGGFTVAAQVGDRVTFQPSFLAILAGVNFLDQAVTVGAGAVRYASNGTATPAVEGDPTAYRASGTEEVKGLGPFTFVATADDISGGVVTFGLWHKGTGTTSTVYASANYPFRWTVRNDGPA